MRTVIPSDPAGFETLENFSRASKFNRWLYEKINKYAFGRVIEIGSGLGNISSFLLRDHTNITLSDLRPEYCSYLEKFYGNHPHLQGICEIDLSVKDFKFKHPELLESFDTVIALNVVEHIENDALAILNAKCMLRKNGKLIILVPAGRWLYNLLDKELGHFQRYSRKTLNDKLESAGFKVCSSHYFNGAAVLGWWFSGSILKEKIISPKKLKVFDQFVPLFRILDWIITPFTGLSVISVGEIK